MSIQESAAITQIRHISSGTNFRDGQVKEKLSTFQRLASSLHELIVPAAGAFEVEDA